MGNCAPRAQRSDLICLPRSRADASPPSSSVDDDFASRLAWRFPRQDEDIGIGTAFGAAYGSGSLDAGDVDSEATIYWGTRCRNFDPRYDRRCSDMFAGGNRLWAISTLDGSPKWNFSSPFGFGATPLVDDDFV